MAVSVCHSGRFSNKEGRGTREGTTSLVTKKFKFQKVPLLLTPLFLDSPKYWAYIKMSEFWTPH